MTALLQVDTAPQEFHPTPITGAEAAAMFRAVVMMFTKWDITDDQAAIVSSVEDGRTGQN
jgi:hypothetical protein